MSHLQLVGISKFFPGVKALDGISFELLPGEVHALCGENGAGKSTLMNILTGNLKPDAGDLILNGNVISINGPAQASELGIAIVYQQLSLIDTLSVAENIFANTQPVNAWGFIQYGRLFEKTKILLESLQISYIAPEKMVGELSPAEKQMVEIAKALSKDPEILILDEPTASITDRESKTLFSMIRQLKSAGKSVIYISHRMEEIFAISDRVSVLKDGRYQGTGETSEMTPAALIRLMVGRDILNQRWNSAATKKVLLEVKGLSGQGFSDISLKVHAGEIVGLAGLIGAGRTEIAQTIFGYRSRISGEIFIENQNINSAHPADATLSGLGYVPEERKSQGVFLNKNLTDNILAAHLKAATDPTWYNAEKASWIATEYMDKLHIASPDADQLVMNLSGGNQQKVVLAKWLLNNPKVLIIDEPTQGIDVGAKAEIYQLLRQLTREGKGILLISSELPEMLTLADRILVIRAGKLAGAVAAEETTEEEILSLATG
jgi:ABC-type sugar transport system ATPase subunit